MPTSRRTFIASGAAVAAVAPRKYLSSAYPPDRLPAALIPRERWKPYPAASERAPWEGLPADARKAAVEAAEAQLGKPWAPLPATLFLEYRRIGNRSNYERVRSRRREQLRELVLAECVEGKGRFVDEIVNGIWTTCEETFWGVPAHMGPQKAGVGLPDTAEPIVDLFAAETASLLAWTWYLLKPQLAAVSPLVPERVRLDIDRRVLTPCLTRNDFGWMGLAHSNPVNNWNPWINSNWLTCALVIEMDEKRRLAAVSKILRSLDRFLDGYHDDGGCDEGPSYWFRAGGSLFDNLDLLQSASNGAMDFYKSPLVREIGRYIYRAHISGNYFTNFADAPAKVNMSADLVFRYGRAIGDDIMAAFGAWAAAAQKAGSERTESIGRNLPALFNLNEIRNAPRAEALVRDVWLPGIQVMAARRKAGTTEGLYLAAQGGHNAESHNHNDVGNFMVYAGGEPVIIDVGVETYSAKTFSSKRYEIWTMQSAYHNLPTIDGVMQAAGRAFAATEAACQAGDRMVEFRLNIAKAYPPEAGIDFWRRTFRFDRTENRIEIADAYSLNKPANRITLTLMSASKPIDEGGGRLRLAGSTGVRFDAGALKPSIEEIPLEDSRLRGTWGERIWRILLVAERPPREGRFNLVISQS
ncbi:MAG: heparinase II/III family protein [Acidobacteriota bacterium]